MLLLEPSATGKACLEASLEDILIRSLSLIVQGIETMYAPFLLCLSWLSTSSQKHLLRSIK
jgi:hypothetical protein